MDKFTIEFYERENGDIPVEEFLLGLDKKMRAKIWVYYRKKEIS